MNRSVQRRLPLPALAIATLAALTACTPEPARARESAPAESAGTNVAELALEELEELEVEYDARLGVYAIDTGTGQAVDFRGDERFAFASTYKALAAAAVLEQNSLAELDEVIAYTSDDLVTHSPITENSVDTGMSLRDLAVAAIQYSDNTAGNLLFDELGGPAGFDAALTELGDTSTRADREETELNDTAPGDDRDTSTPRALADDLGQYVLGDTLDPEKQALLTAWLKGNTTGDNLIRAGVPDGWVVGDKTGAAGYGTRNDIAVIWPPAGAPIVLVVLSDRDAADADYDDALIAAAARITVDALTD
jgi:beta-lactamase class A